MPVVVLCVLPSTGRGFLATSIPLKTVERVGRLAVAAVGANTHSQGGDLGNLVVLEAFGGGNA
eukprot:13661029-Alexandrium_andersonii.AAC.1